MLTIAGTLHAPFKDDYSPKISYTYIMYLDHIHQAVIFFYTPLTAKDFFSQLIPPSVLISFFLLSICFLDKMKHISFWIVVSTLNTGKLTFINDHEIQTF